jgi:hypothetical protein
VVPEGIDPDNVDEFIAGLDVVVEECDDLAMKLLVREAARRQRVTVVMETSDRGMLDVERFDLEPDRPAFHGLLGDVSADELDSLTVAQKVPYVLAIVDAPQGSARGTASLAEIGRTVSSWPQLGSDVTLGGAAVAAVVRRLGLGDDVPSGRTRIDLDAAVSSLEPPVQVSGAPKPRVPPVPPSGAADVGRAIVHAATLAPSCGNGQPWRFELSSRDLVIALDRSRSCGTMDLSSRASFVGLGAALFNARVAAAAAGRLGPYRLFPEGPSSDVVASLELGTASDPSLAELHGAMLERCSNRRQGTPTPLDLAEVSRMSRAATEEHAQLHLVTGTDRLTECAEIFAAAERIRFLSPQLREDTLREMRWPGEDVRTGIDLATLELSGPEAGSLQMLGRGDVMDLLEHWDAGGALGDYLARAIGASSAVAIVTVESASPASYLSGGMALERVWIEAQRSGWAVQAIAPAFLYAVQQRDYQTLGGTRWAEELRRLAERFRALVDLGTHTAGILTLRLSRAAPPHVRSARLPLDQVLRRRAAP